LYFVPLVLALSSCGAHSASATSQTPKGWPKVLRFNVSTSQENPEVEGSRLRPIGVYLESQLHIPVEVTGTTGYGVFIEALRANKIEAGTMGSFGYLIAFEKAQAEVIAMRGNLDGTAGLYSGGIAVAAGSPIKTIEDVVKRAHELTVSFVDPASGSGNFVQRAYLDSLGIDPERDFKKVVFSQNHMTSVLTLVNGKTDVAAVGETVVPALIASKQLKPGDVRFLWISPRIPEGPVVVRHDLPQDLKDKLQDAIVRISTEAPDAYYNMTAKVYRERYRNKKFIPATDADFESLRKLAKGMKLTQVLE
jgi:phosphonate transport system substrate-binding protein